MSHAASSLADKTGARNPIYPAIGANWGKVYADRATAKTQAEADRQAAAQSAADDAANAAGPTSAPVLDQMYNAQSANGIARTGSESDVSGTPLAVKRRTGAARMSLGY